MPRGTRESQWLVLRRCLAIIRRVQRGPATWQGLLEAVASQEGADAYGEGTVQARRLRLEKDLARVRDKLGVEIAFDRREGGYMLRDTWLPLIDLPGEDLATIAWLGQTFDHASPQHDEVQALLGRLRLYLAPERREEIERRRTTLAVDLAQRDEDVIPTGIWEGLTRALVGRRRVEISYASPQHEDGAPRRHVADPYERYFDTARGHYYLHAWCHYSEGPEGRREQGRYIDYRLGRIRALQLLPDKLPPVPPRAPRYCVEYELAARVARLGVTRPREIEVREVERRADGSALVRGETQSPFWAVQALLHYGANCRVLGGAEVLERMRATVKEMAGLYGTTDVGVS